MSTSKRNILTIAGSDSSGGAGIQADIKSISANGGYAMSVITLVTAQNSQGITDIQYIETNNIEKQMDAVFSDYSIDAVKIGALGNGKIIDQIIRSLKKWKPRNIVVDPVMIATTGASLFEKKDISKMYKLFTLATLITPNIQEAEFILENKITNKEEQVCAAKEFMNRFKVPVLLKGCHINDKVIVDILITTDEEHFFENKKIETKNTHGTGCTLSSAIATHLGKGKNLSKATKAGIKYVANGIKHSLDIGSGHGPLDHFGGIK